MSSILETALKNDHQLFCIWNDVPFFENTRTCGDPKTFLCTDPIFHFCVVLVHFYDDGKRFSCKTMRFSNQFFAHHGDDAYAYFRRIFPHDVFINVLRRGPSRFSFREEVKTAEKIGAHWSAIVHGKHGDVCAGRDYPVQCFRSHEEAVRFYRATYTAAVSVKVDLYFYKRFAIDYDVIHYIEKRKEYLPDVDWDAPERRLTVDIINC